MTSSSKEVLRNHCTTLIEDMASGRLVPVFGPGVSLSNVTKTQAEAAEDLSEGIAKAVEYPWRNRKNLQRVSWYGKNRERDLLYGHLHDVFFRGHPTEAYKFFAELPGKLSKKGYRDRRQLVVTTSYDLFLENAFFHANEQYDLLTYVANSDDKSEEGKFRYLPYGGEARIFDERSNFELPIEENVLRHTIILKMQGTVDSVNAKEGTFAVTDEDYIDYLARPNTPAHNVPVFLQLKMQQSRFLFLGLSIADWSQRVVLRSLIQPRRKFDPGSHAIMQRTEEWDREYWEQYGVELLEVSLNDYIDALREALENLPSGGGDGGVA